MDSTFHRDRFDSVPRSMAGEADGMKIEASFIVCTGVAGCTAAACTSFDRLALASRCINGAARKPLAPSITDHLSAHFNHANAFGQILTQIL